MIITIAEDTDKDTSRKRIAPEAVELVRRGTLWYVRSQEDINRCKDGVFLGQIGRSALFVRLHHEVEIEATLTGPFGAHVLTIEMPSHLILRGFGGSTDGLTLETVLIEGEYYDANLHNCDFAYRRGKN